MSIEGLKLHERNVGGQAFYQVEKAGLPREDVGGRGATAVSKQRNAVADGHSQ